MKYLSQKENLENQGWRSYQKIGAKVYFRKENVYGIIVEVDVYDGNVIVQTGAPEDYVKMYLPELI